MRGGGTRGNKGEKLRVAKLGRKTQREGKYKNSQNKVYRCFRKENKTHSISIKHIFSNNPLLGIIRGTNGKGSKGAFNGREWRDNDN